MEKPLGRSILAVPLCATARDLDKFLEPSWRKLEWGLLNSILLDSEFAQVVDAKVAAEASKEVLQTIATIWPALGEPDPDLRRIRLRATFVSLAALEPNETPEEVSEYWIAILLAKTMERYAADIVDTLSAIDVLFAVLGYPERLVELTTFGDCEPGDGERTDDIAKKRIDAARRYVGTFLRR